MKSKCPTSDLLSRLSEPFTGEALFDCLTDLVYFIKNEQCEYVMVNQEMVKRLGYREKSEIIGRKADEIYPSPLGQSYRLQDERIIRSGEPILNQLEMQVYLSGKTGWCLTFKLPLRDAAGKVIGIVGISKNLQAPNESGEGFLQIARAVQHIQQHFDEPLKLAPVAALAGLSVYQFEQRIIKIFQITAGQFILKVRMDAAARQLRETSHPVTMIAQDCGYSDQSAFSRQFRQTVGLSPAQFRRAAIKRRLASRS